MSTHTPGPWVTQKELREAYKRGMLRVYQSPPLPSPDEANARLIAAAPAMLEALKMLLASLEWEKTRSGTTYNGYETARGAVALAERGTV